MNRLLSLIRLHGTDRTKSDLEHLVTLLPKPVPEKGPHYRTPKTTQSNDHTSIELGYYSGTFEQPIRFHNLVEALRLYYACQTGSSTTPKIIHDPTKDAFVANIPTTRGQIHFEFDPDKAYLEFVYNTSSRQASRITDGFIQLLMQDAEIHTKTI